MILLEITFQYNNLIMRGFFKSERKANNARRKLAAEMQKGKFKNGDDIFEIKHDAGVISVKVSDITAACVFNDEIFKKPETE